jgi:predicted amidohydrolase YtcJ
MPTSDREGQILFVNGTVRTMEPAQMLAGAVLVQGGRIAYVGDGREARRRAGSGVRIVDLGGRALLPGFIDNHTHLVLGGHHLLGIDLRVCATPEEFRAAIGAHVSRHPGRWVTGGTWDHETWPEKKLPCRQAIDDVSGGTPVFVRRLDGHMGLANSLALRMAGISGATPDPKGGVIVRDPATGEPTGILKDTAMNIVQAVIPKPSRAENERAVKLAMAEARRRGITSVHDITLEEDLEVYSALDRERKLTLRIYARLPLAGFQTLVDRGIRAGSGTPFLRLGSVKAFADGSLGSNTAWFFDPYRNDPSSTGLAMDTLLSGELRRCALEADRNGLQLSVHAIGDRANHAVLTLFEEIQAVNPPWERRFRIEHAQHVRPADVARFRKLGVIVSAQPYHAIDDGCWAESRIGKERLGMTYAFRTFLGAGVHVCFGSDWTVAPLDALAGIFAAVTRRTLDGKNPQGWIPEQKLSVEEALRCYTVEGAYAAFEEREKGSIVGGKDADLIVLSRDPVAEDEDDLRSLEVDLTMVNGEVVYER